MYLAAVARAVAAPGTWVDVPRVFGTYFNALITAACLEGGYLRVEPRDGDVAVTIRGKRYIKTAGPVECEVRPAGGGWKLRVRA